MKIQTGIILFTAVCSGLILTGCGPEETISIDIAENSTVLTEKVTEAAAVEVTEAVRTETAVTEAVTETTEADSEVSSVSVSEEGVTEAETEAETAASLPGHDGFWLVTSNPRPGTAGPEFKPLAGKWEDGLGNVIDFTECADYEAKFTKTGSDGSSVSGNAYIEYSFGTDSYAVYWYNLYSDAGALLYSFRYTGEIPVQSLSDGTVYYEKSAPEVTAAE